MQTIAGCPGADIVPTDAATAAVAEQAILCLINVERAKVGARPLAFSNQLAGAARGHSKDMVAHHLTGDPHTGSDGSTPSSRIQASGYCGAGCSQMRENVYYWAGTIPASQAPEWGGVCHAGDPGATPRATVAWWMNHSSPSTNGHRQAILNKALTEAGVGAAIGTPSYSYGVTYTADFGSRL